MEKNLLDMNCGVSGLKAFLLADNDGSQVPLIFVCVCNHNEKIDVMIIWKSRPYSGDDAKAEKSTNNPIYMLVIVQCQEIE
jgi:hypothetical protein